MDGFADESCMAGGGGKKSGGNKGNTGNGNNGNNGNGNGDNGNGGNGENGGNGNGGNGGDQGGALERHVGISETDDTQPFDDGSSFFDYSFNYVVFL